MKLLKLIGITLIIFFLFFTHAASQNPNGIKLNTNEAFDGYTLIQNDVNTYLINNCGEILKTWEDFNYATFHPKLIENGSLVFIGDNSVVEVKWDGSMKEVSHGEEGLNLRYELVVLPNGNYLCVGRRDLFRIGFRNIGYAIPGTDPSEIDVVVELDKDTGEIVWEWNIKDHVIQERDPAVTNYGILSEHPELLNLDAISTFDWNFQESFMINGMDYNAELDLIVLSVRKLSEIIIIDHSTTTEEAAGHTGGNHGKGGDILYRWGNPENYRSGTPDDRQLYFQHNPNWIDEGPHAGKLIIYDNGLSRPGTGYGGSYSTVPIISLPIDSDGKFVKEEFIAFEPMEPDVVFDGRNDAGRFYSGYTSGAAILPNDNIFITQGSRNALIELNPQGEKVWEYIVFRGGYIFRAEKYPKDYPGFDRLTLTPQGTIENPPSDYDCELLFSNTEKIELENIFVNVRNNPSNSPEVNIKNLERVNIQYTIHNLFGQKLIDVEDNGVDIIFDISNLPVSSYILIVRDLDSKGQKAFKIVKL
jgi:hypothetical protein